MGKPLRIIIFFIAPALFQLFPKNLQNEIHLQKYKKSFAN